MKSAGTRRAATDPIVLLRKPDRPVRYWTVVRWLDVWAGRRDGGRGMVKLPNATKLPDDSTAWQRHNGHRLNERLAAEKMTYQTLQLQLSTRHTELAAAIETATDTLNLAREQLRHAHESIPDAAAHPTESHMSEEQIRARRAREYSTTVTAPARARCDRAEEELRTLTAEQNRVAATLRTLTEIHESRADRLREYHARRNGAYERAYLRHFEPVNPGPTVSALRP